MSNGSDDNSQELAIAGFALSCFVAVALYVAVAVPTLIWSTLHGEPTLVSFSKAVGGESASLCRAPTATRATSARSRNTAM